MKTRTKFNANKKDKKEDSNEPQKRSTIIASRLSNGNRSISQSDVIMRYVSEYGGLERTYDEYDRYEDIFDANANEYLVNQDASIILSEITINDTHGRNRTLVRTQRR